MNVIKAGYFDERGMPMGFHGRECAVHQGRDCERVQETVKGR